MSSSSSSSSNPPKCTLYLAPSTIPNAGLGVFTSIPLPSGTLLPGGGDAVVPISDLDFHNDASAAREDYHWLISEYSWASSSLGEVMDYEAEKTSGWSPGYGAVPNCHNWMNNVEESECDFDTVGLTPGNSPGAGAFTGYYNRIAHASEDIRAGSELFRKLYGVVPLEDDFQAAGKFLEGVSELLESLVTTGESKESDDNDHVGDEENLQYMEQVQADIWNLIINTFPYKSRPLAALPKTYNAAIRAMDVGITQTEEELATHSLEYLEKHGKCLDHIQPKNSTIPHAGRGAFATRYLPQGTIVSYAPLVHIPDRDILTMYADTEDGEKRDKSKPIGHQLLLNYCWGHPSSSLLLCPYSHGTSFINHDGQNPNVKIKWAENDEQYHNSTWLNEPVTFFDSAWTTRLMFEYVALRDIQEDEEVLVDYGKEWEEAWNEHVKAWKPVENYVSPNELNTNFDIPLKTHEEDESLYADMDGWHTDETNEERVIYRITARKPDPNNEDGYIYDLEVVGIGKQVKLLKNVPRSRIHFFHQPYKGDTFMRGSFRHEMMIPDEMFPKAWRNL